MEINFNKNEYKILRFWEKNRIFEKSIERRKKARNFVFYEGPPTANAKPGIHHILARNFKDVICRYKTMRGFRVLRKAGWDTHGLPVELQIEKKLGLKNKKDIENYGIAKFNQKCKESVWQNKKDWEKTTKRFAYWLDLEHPYITYETDYIESVWWILKQIYEKGLLYKDYKVVPYCPRCGTTLSSHEVAQGYEKIKEMSVYVKFRIKNPEFKDCYLLIWTTTPWTLPGNVAVAINPKINYVKAKIGEEYLILAKERLGVLGENPEIVEEIKGEKLIGLQYQPLFDFYSPDYKKERIWEVVAGDFVSTEDGTGLVHIAPAFGEEDMSLIKMVNSKITLRGVNSQNSKEKFPILMTVNEEGKFNLDVKEWAGIFVKEADPLIIENLKSSNLLFKEELYEHDYPFCWRCHSPLLYYAKESWFINMQKVKQELIDGNKKINWVPSHLKEGRFGEWLKEVKDWAFSRERYWGTPLPAWQCKSCGKVEVIGSKKDLVSQNFSQNRYFVLRHGEYPGNINKTANCWPEKTPLFLTKKGREQIKKAAGKLKKEKIDLIFSSDLKRTVETAEIVGKELGLKPRLDKRLREINVGFLNGKSVSKEAGKFWDKEGKLSPVEYYQKRFKLAPRGGENYNSVEKRMFGFMKNMERSYPGKNILIVSHERPITLLEKILYGYSLEEFVDIIVGKKAIKIGEIRELEFKNLPYNEKMELDFHRPYIDGVEFLCKGCGGEMRRTEEVVDCWFDSGSMPFAQAHFPFAYTPARKSEQNYKNLIKKIQFPADYICEGIDQTRGWFYTLLAISTLLGFGAPYKNVISVGIVLDEKGEKMSKSKGNMVDPWYIAEKYGVDALRWYFYTINQPAESKLFSEKDVDQNLKKTILTLWNSYLFWETYGKNQKFKFSGGHSRKPKNVLDRWIVSKLNLLIAETANSLDEYDVVGAARSIEGFIINDLSLWYIRRSRARFQKPKDEKELKEVSCIFGEALSALSKITAPFIPFLSEEIYQRISNSKFLIPRSVHLEDWPKADKKLIDKKLEEKMDRVREIVALALAERAKAGIKVRQPLAKLKVKSFKFKDDKELLDLIKEEINVKEVVFNGKMQKEVELNTEITPELKEEGMIREVIRYIQDMRKRAKLRPKDRIFVRFSGGKELAAILEKNKSFIMKEGRIKSFLFVENLKGEFNIKEEIMVDKQKLWLAIKRI